MSRPTLEVADIVRAAGESFWDKHKSHFAWVHRKVLNAIVRCRTAALGGHLDKYIRCGHQAISFNSCRNRHCPKCQGNARAKWLAARSGVVILRPQPVLREQDDVIGIKRPMLLSCYSPEGTRSNG